MPRAQGCAGAAYGFSNLHGNSKERYAAGAGQGLFPTISCISSVPGGQMRTTAGMQEVEQRRSSCRGAAYGFSSLHGNSKERYAGADTYTSR